MIKWLRSCIVWLIGWLILLPSFSSAYDLLSNNSMIEATIPDTAVIWNFVYVFNSNWNIATDNYWQFLYWESKDSGNTYDYVYWRINWQLYFAGLYNNSVQKQGYIQKFSMCDNPVNSSQCISFTLTGSDFYFMDLNITKIIVWNNGWRWLQTQYWNDPFRLCFYDSKSAKYYCVQNAIWTNWYVDTPLSNSLWFTNTDSIKNFGSWWSSPFVPTTNNYVVPDYEFNEDDNFTNQQIIEGYNHMGLTDEFCYWGFAINNIFQNWQVPSEFTWYRRGGGASIFDIWNIYSWAYNNNYTSFLGTFYLAYTNNNYSEFYGYPKSLYGFVDQWGSVSSKWLSFIEATAPQFTLVDIWQYCDIKFHKNPNDQYTWNRRDPKRNYYRSWQVDLGGYFNFSWNNNYFSWSLSGFDTPKDFFASLNAIFQWGLKWLSSNHDPLIPSYILVFMFAIILIRMLSH